MRSRVLCVALTALLLFAGSSSGKTQKKAPAGAPGPSPDLAPTLAPAPGPEAEPPAEAPSPEPTPPPRPVKPPTPKPSPPAEKSPSPPVDKSPSPPVDKSSSPPPKKSPSPAPAKSPKPPIVGNSCATVTPGQAKACCQQKADAGNWEDQWCIDNFRDLFQNNFESPPPDNTDPGTSPGLADGCAAVNLEQDQACCRRQVANNVIDQYCLDNYPVLYQDYSCGALQTEGQRNQCCAAKKARGIADDFCNGVVLAPILAAPPPSPSPSPSPPPPLELPTPAPAPAPEVEVATPAPAPAPEPELAPIAAPLLPPAKANATDSSTGNEQPPNAAFTSSQASLAACVLAAVVGALLVV